MNMNTLTDHLTNALNHTEANLLIGVQFEDGTIAIYPHWEFEGDLDETIVLTAAIAADKYSRGAVMVTYAMKQ